jgi:hypothetical protein
MFSAQLKSPGPIAVDSTGSLYIADYEEHVIRRVFPNGTIVTFAGNRTAAFAGDGGPVRRYEEGCNNLSRKILIPPSHTHLPSPPIISI